MMSDSIARVLQKPETPPNSKSRIAWYIFVRLAQRLTFTLALMLGVIFFVALAISLANRGGYRSIAEAAPEAVDATVQVLGDLFGGRLEAMDELIRVLPRSLGLLFASLALGGTLGILLGGLAALYRKSRLSSIIINGSIIGVSTPSYVAAMFLIWTVVAIYQRTDVRILPVFGFGWDLRIVMPTLVLATRPMANITRLTYTALKDIYDADYVRTAYSKGLLPRTVFLYHVLKNAGVPILTTASVSFRFSLSMLPIVESIFTWLGIGYALIQAGQAGDFPRVVVMILPLVILFALSSILLDFLYPLIDPRLFNAKGVE
ncbi:MAG: ABC transporter permease [Anaerolineales bacterium]|nr:MAG: ABC transporter permease [Anaerolineales bacterium]